MKTNIQKPKQLYVAIILLIASIVLSVGNIFIREITTGEMILQNGTDVLTLVFGQAIIVFFIYNINIGKKWARTTLLVFSILGYLMIPFTLSSGAFKTSMPVVTIQIIIYVIQTIALILMFSPKCNQWFNSRGKSGTPDNHPRNSAQATFETPIYTNDNGNPYATRPDRDNRVQNQRKNTGEYQGGNPYS